MINLPALTVIRTTSLIRFVEVMLNRSAAEGFGALKS
jgi:hypothetical protein